MELTERQAYARWGLDAAALAQLGKLGDLLLGAGFNVTSVREPTLIERFHFLDCLALLTLPALLSARNIADVGAGAGLPALVLAIVLPTASVTAIESNQKKCRFIDDAASALGLGNVHTCCRRAEEYGRESGREAHDAVTSRALASLPVVAEYSFPLLEEGGTMVAMKGAISDQERIQAEKAIAILGGDGVEAMRLEPFSGAENRCVYVSRKVMATPPLFPRRAGVAVRKPLGDGS